MTTGYIQVFICLMILQTLDNSYNSYKVSSTPSVLSIETEQNLVSVNIDTIMESNALVQNSKVAVLTTDEVEQFIKGQKAKHTSYKDTCDMKKLKDFCENISESRNIDDIPAPELNCLLFFHEN